MIDLSDLFFKEAKVEEVDGFETTKSIEGEVTISTGRLPVLLEYFSVKSKNGRGVIIELGLRTWTSAC